MIGKYFCDTAHVVFLFVCSKDLFPFGFSDREKNVFKSGIVEKKQRKDGSNRILHRKGLFIFLGDIIYRGVYL